MTTTEPDYTRNALVCLHAFDQGLVDMLTVIIDKMLNDTELTDVEQQMVGRIHGAYWRFR